MPQKLTKLSEFDGSAEAMLRRPELAAMIAAVASRATRIEDTFARLFVYLLNREEEAALSIYLEFINRDTRKVAFDAVARVRLSADDKKKFDAITKKLRDRLGDRNKLVHGWWAVSDEHPDALLLIDSDEYHLSHFRYIHADFKDEVERLAYIKNAPENYTIQKYTERDFREILDRLFDFQGEVENFILYTPIIR